MDPTDDWYVLVARGKRVTFDSHALVGQSQEARRQPVSERHILQTLEKPDILAKKKGGFEAHKWLGKRTVIVRYEEYEDEIYVYSISATRRRLAS